MSNLVAYKPTNSNVKNSKIENLPANTNIKTLDEVFFYGSQISKSNGTTNQTDVTIYQVPVGYYFFLTNAYIVMSVSSTTTNGNYTYNIQNSTKSINVLAGKISKNTGLNNSQNIYATYNFPMIVQENDTIIIEASGGGDINSSVSARVTGFLVPKTWFIDKVKQIN